MLKQIDRPENIKQRDEDETLMMENCIEEGEGVINDDTEASQTRLDQFRTYAQKQ